MMRDDIASHVRAGEYDKAEAALLGMTDERSLSHLSMLYRFLNRYGDEYELVLKGLGRFPESHYLLGRREWHQLPELEKTEARPPLQLDRTTDSQPSSGAMASLCFVTGGDSNYFTLMMECIESIRATLRYRHTPVNIIDCGLIEDEKVSLISMLEGGEIVDVAPCIEISEFHTLDRESGEPVVQPAVPRRYTSIVNKALLPELFPGYEFYFWINANCWVQNEAAIDAFLKLCETQGMVYPDPSHGNARPLALLPRQRTNYIPSEFREQAFGQRHGCDAVFCSTGQMLREICEIVKEFVSLNNGIYFYYFFELAQSVLRSRHPEMIDPPISHYAHFSYLQAKSVGYKPLVYEDNTFVIYSQHCPDEPIGILRPTGLDDHEHVLFVQDESHRIIREIRGSTRFRVLPWRDKSNLLRVLTA